MNQPQASLDLIEERFLVRPPSIAASVTGCFVALHGGTNGEISELLTVGQSQRLARYFLDASSASGWTEEEVAIAGAPNGSICKLIASRIDDTLCVFVHYESSGSASRVLGMQRTPDGKWAPMAFDSQVTTALANICCTDCVVDGSGRTLFYGMVRDAQTSRLVVIGRQEVGTWCQVLAATMPGAGTTCKLMTGIAGSDLALITFEALTLQVQLGTLSAGAFQTHGAAIKSTSLTSLQPEHLVRLPSAPDELMWLMRTSSQQLFQIQLTGNRLLSSQLTDSNGQRPSGVIEVTATATATGQAFVFASDTSRQLWLLRAPSSTDGVSPSSAWVALGNEVDAISCPAKTESSPQVYIRDAQGIVGRLVQDLTQGNWFMSEITVAATAGQALLDTATFTADLAVVDSNGLPVGNAAVSVSTDRPCLVVANGLASQVSSATPASATSDALGRIRLTVEANSLISPVFTVSSPALNSPISMRADLAAHRRLANQDPTFPVNGAALRSAGLISASVSDSQADVIAAQLVSIGRIAVSMHPATTQASSTANAPPEEIRPFTWSANSMGNQIAPRELTADEAAAMSTAASESLSHLWGDVFHRLRNRIEELEHVTLKYVPGAVVVELTISGVLSTFHLSSLTAVADFASVFVHWITHFAKAAVNAMKAALAWLRSLFHWKDVLNTKAVLEHYLRQALSKLKASDTDFQNEIVGRFTAFKGEIIAKIDQWQDLFSATVSFGNIPAPSPANPIFSGGSALEFAGLRSAFEAHSARCRYLLSKFTSEVSHAVGDLPMTLPPQISWSRVVQVFTTAFPIGQVEAQWEQLRACFSRFTSSGSFLHIAIYDLLQAAKAFCLFVLDAIEDCLLAVCELASGLFEAFDAILWKELELGILSSLYHEISGGKSLSIGDFACLAVAAPATLLYKLLLGGHGLNPPFSSDEVSAFVSQDIPWPSSVNAKQVLAMATAPGCSINIKGVQIAAGVLGLLGGILDAWLDFLAFTFDLLRLPPTWQITVTGIVAIALSVIGQVLSPPQECGSSGEGLAQILAWWTGWIPIAIDIGCSVDLKAMVRFQGDAGPFLSCVLGAVALVMGGVVASYASAPVDKAAAVMPAFSSLAKPLLVAAKKVDDPRAMLAILAALLAIDFGSDWSSAIITICQA